MPIPNGIVEKETPSEAALRYKVVKRASKPVEMDGLTKIDVDMVWLDSYGDHAFHVESFARRGRNFW